MVGAGTTDLTLHLTHPNPKHKTENRAFQVIRPQGTNPVSIKRPEEFINRTLNVVLCQNQDKVSIVFVTGIGVIDYTHLRRILEHAGDLDSSEPST